MLAALLVDVDRTVPVDALVERVWGDRAPQRVRGTLYGYLSRLRRAPGAVAAISRRPGGYVLEADPLSVDLHLFRDLIARARAAEDERAAALMRRAFGLWRGEPFATVDVPWFSDLRQALERERFSAELDHVDIRLRTGRHGELLPEPTLRAGEHPMGERLAGRLMLALYRTGRAADALAHYQDVRQRLARELGADPGPRLRGLHQRILADDPALFPSETSSPETSPPGAPAGASPSAPAGTPAGVAASAPVPRQLPAPPAHFVGRYEEIAVLDKMLAARTGPRTAMPLSVICGTAGVGKTWLALRRAHGRRISSPMDSSSPTCAASRPRVNRRTPMC